MKTCTKCNLAKPFDQFSRHKGRSDGLQNRCKQCVRSYNQKYYEQNAESIKKAVRKTRLENPDLIKKRKKIYHAANAEKIQSKVAKWKKLNPDKVRINARRFRQTHKEQVALLSAARRAKLRQNGVYKVTDKEASKLYASKCFYCGSKQNIEADHIIPISKGGRHSIGNLVPACRSCNIAKSNKLLIEWLQERKNNGKS